MGRLGQKSAALDTVHKMRAFNEYHAIKDPGGTICEVLYTDNSFSVQFRMYIAIKNALILLPRVLKVLVVAPRVYSIFVPNGFTLLKKVQR